MTFEIDRRNLLQMLGLAAVSGSVLSQATIAFAADTDNVTIGWPSDVPSWDPNLRFVPDAQPLFKMVFDQPLDQSPDLKLIGNLITKWELKPDGLSMPFEIRSDVKFHNGDPMTMEDFKYTFVDRIKSGLKLDIANSWRTLTDIEILSPTSGVMKFSAPTPTAPQWLAFLGSYLVPKKYIESVGPEEFAKKPIGTGPYKLVDYQMNSRIVLERNDAYFGTKPKIKRVTIDIIKDPSARTAAIQSGQVDLTVNIPVREAERLGKTEGLTAEINPFTRLILLQMRNDLGFTDKAVRLAAHHAIDKAALSKAFYGGAAVPLSIPATPARRVTCLTTNSPTTRNCRRSSWPKRATRRTSRQPSSSPPPTDSSRATSILPVPWCRCGRRSASRSNSNRSNIRNISSSTAAASCRKRPSTASTTLPATRKSSPAI